jgi:predicted nucleic acid-binding protein
VAQFTEDWRRFRLIELDEAVCSAAAELAEQTGARTLDALHLAAALQAGEAALVTYDRRLGEAAERSGLTVVAP